MARCVESIRNEAGFGKLEVMQDHVFGLAICTVQELLHGSLSPSHLHRESHKLKAEGGCVNKADVGVCGTSPHLSSALVF